MSTIGYRFKLHLIEFERGALVRQFAGLSVSKNFWLKDYLFLSWHSLPYSSETWSCRKFHIPGVKRINVQPNLRDFLSFYIIFLFLSRNVYSIDTQYKKGPMGHDRINSIKWTSLAPNSLLFPCNEGVLRPIYLLVPGIFCVTFRMAVY